MKLIKVVFVFLICFSVSVNAGCVGTARTTTTDTTATDIVAGIIKASPSISSYESLIKLNYVYSVGDSIGYEITESIDFPGKKLHSKLRIISDPSLTTPPPPPLHPEPVKEKEPQFQRGSHHPHYLPG
jgi:hypothetical protein